ncbi:uncharacterized protein LOC115213478 [Argonauta hians]
MNKNQLSQTPRQQSHLAAALTQKKTLLWDNYKDSIAYLYDYLLELSRDEFYLENTDVFQQMIPFVGHVHSYLSNPGNLKYITISASFIHYTISVLIETIHVIVCLKISQKALNSGTVVISYRTHSRMKKALTLTKNLEKKIIDLEECVDKVCCQQNKAPNLQSLENIMEQIKNIKSILSYLLKSSTHLADVLTKKVDDKLHYFDLMSLSVTVLCFGQIIRSLVAGQQDKDLCEICLWFTCVGSSGIVLQLPRALCGDTRDILLHHCTQYRKLAALFQLENKKL